MKFGTYLILCLMLASCATKQEKAAIAELKLKHDEIWALSKEQSKTEEFYNYLNDIFLPITNKFRLDLRGNCYRLPGRNTRLVLHIAENGLIEKVSGWPEGKRLNCYKKSFIGIVLPPPPFSPLLMNMTFE
ncbi:hypothetical protein [Sessilibacter corallicola]